MKQRKVFLGMGEQWWSSCASCLLLIGVYPNCGTVWLYPDRQVISNHGDRAAYQREPVRGQPAMRGSCHAGTAGGDGGGDEISRVSDVSG